MVPPSTRTRPESRENFEIAIVCALPLEFDAVVYSFDQFWDEDGDLYGRAAGDVNSYTTGRIGTYDVVLTLLPSMGKATAAGAAASLRGSYPNLKLVLLTGVCGGVPKAGRNREILLGDVIISKKIVQYDLGRRYRDKFICLDTVNLDRSNRDLKTFIQTLETERGRRRLQGETAKYLHELQERAEDLESEYQYEYVGPGNDVLFEAQYIHRHRGPVVCDCRLLSSGCETAMKSSCDELQCDTSHTVRRQRLDKISLPVAPRDPSQGPTPNNHDPRIFVGAIGSGDTVMKSGEDRDKTATEHGLVAFEMEGAGLYDEVPCIVVKGVCDYADSHKNKQWQPYAAATAAATAKALLDCYNKMDKLATPSSPANTENQRPHVYFSVPYNVNPDFVGRVHILDEIKTFFGHAKESVKQRSRISLYGLGGVGKTQIALQYAYWLRKTHPDTSIFWVHAAGAERFRESYNAIATECQIPGYNDSRTDVFSLVKSWLEKEQRGPWLMVIDNADDMELFFSTCGAVRDQTSVGLSLGRYIPECGHGCILATTRDKKFGTRFCQGRSSIEVSEIDDDEAHRLISAILKDETIPALETASLAEHLEHLPLALAQAASFILENDISVGKYLQLLDEGDSALIERLSEPFETVGRDSRTPHAVTTTWIISFQQIEKQHRLASDILCLLCHLDRQGIPEDYISYYCDHNQTTTQDFKPASLIKAIGTLKAFSFISETTDQTYSIHRLVHLVTRKWLSGKADGEIAKFEGLALRAVSHNFPHGGFETRQDCLKQLPHAYAVLNRVKSTLRDVEIAKSNLLFKMGRYLSFQIQLDEVERLLNLATEIKSRILGLDHHETLECRSQLAATISDQGRWKEAEVIQLQVVNLGKAVLGPQNHSILNAAMKGLAIAYARQARPKEAEKLLAEVLEIQSLGEDHLSTMATMNDLGVIYFNLGRFIEAEKILVTVLEARERLLMPDHIDTLATMYNLALLYGIQGRSGDCEELMVRVVETRRRILGPDHPDTLIAMGSRAEVYENQGHWKEAEDIRTQVSEKTARLLRPNHPDALAARNNLAICYGKQGKFEEAEKLLLELVESSKRLLGPDHPQTINSMNNLAMVYNSQKRTEKAEELLVPLVEATKRILGLDHTYTTAVMYNLSLVYNHCGRVSDGRALLMQLLEIYQRVFGPEYPHTLLAMNALAMAHFNLGLVKEAEALLKEVLKTRARVLGPSHPDTIATLRNIILVSNEMDGVLWAPHGLFIVVGQKIEGMEDKGKAL